MGTYPNSEPAAQPAASRHPPGGSQASQRPGAPRSIALRKEDWRALQEGRPGCQAARTQRLRARPARALQHGGGIGWRGMSHVFQLHRKHGSGAHALWTRGRPYGAREGGWALPAEPAMEPVP